MLGKGHSVGQGQRKTVLGHNHLVPTGPAKYREKKIKKCLFKISEIKMLKLI